jgi:hypothetical protein
MQCLKSSLQCKGLGFNLIPNCFCKQLEWMKKHIKRLNFFLSYLLFRTIFVRKTKLIVSPKQVALRNNVSSMRSKMKFLRNRWNTLGKNCTRSKKSFPGNNEFSLGKGPSSLRKRAPSPRSNKFSLWQSPCSHGEHIFWNFFHLKLFHVGFYSDLWPIIEKVSRRDTTLCLKALQSEFIWKDYNHTKIQTLFFSLRNMIAPLGNLSLCSPGNMVIPQSNLSSFSSWT